VKNFANETLAVVTTRPRGNKTDIARSHCGFYFSCKIHEFLYKARASSQYAPLPPPHSGTDDMVESRKLKGEPKTEGQAKNWWAGLKTDARADKWRARGKLIVVRKTVGQSKN
jgi:hypothetical protein